MNRRIVILLLLLIVPAHAQPVASGGYDPALITSVYSVALAFMEPRTLEPVPVPVLTVWGLRGLTALDPNLTAAQRQGKLVLWSGDQPVAEQAVPSGDSPDDWAAAAVRLTGSAFAVSLAVQHAGTQGIIQSFFDELFNHLDPYSRYVPPILAAEDRAGRNGSAGLGLSLFQNHGLILVKGAVFDGPAAMAGIHPGDVIVAVDGTPVRGMTAANVTAMISGIQGSTIRLSWRGRDGQLRAAELERAMVPPETVFAERLRELLLLRVTAFDRSTAAHLERALQIAMAAPEPPSGIILDLRGNRGGLLQEAVQAANQLLPSGIVAYTAGRDTGSSRVWRSDPSELAPGVPVVVVVDGRTASAAEILAAALADRGRAVVVGSTTLGKGLVQTIAPLPDGGELFVTWSRVLAPRGWPIQELGVVPQVCTSLGEIVLQRQLTALAEGQQIMQAPVDAERASRAPLSPQQVLRIRSACPAAEGREADLATARALIDNPAAYAAALLPPMAQVQP